MAKNYRNWRNLTLGTMMVLGSCMVQTVWAQDDMSQQPASSPATGSQVGPFGRRLRAPAIPSTNTSPVTGAPTAVPTSAPAIPVVPATSSARAIPVVPTTSASPVVPAVPLNTMTPVPTSPALLPAIPAQGTAQTAQPTTGGAIGFCNQAMALSSQGQYDQAAQIFGNAIALDPKMTSAYLGRALCYCQSGRYDEAISDCNIAIQLDPNLASAYGMRGTVYYRQQKFNEAAADHSKATELGGGKNSASVNDLLAQSCDKYVAKQYPEAIALADKAVGMEPSNDRAYDIRGLARSENNDSSAAMSDFNQAISMAPDNPDYRCHRGIAEIKAGKLNDAMADLTFAIDRRPDFGIAYYDRGITHILQGDYANGLKDIQEAIRTDHRFALARYEFKQDTAKGRKHAEMAVPEEYYYRACTRILTIKNETALNDLRHYLSKTNWQGPLAPAAVVAIYLGEMRNHSTGSAQNIIKKAQEKCNKTVWPYPVICYLHNDMPVTDLLSLVSSQEQLSDAHAYVGLSEVFKGPDTAAVNPHLEWIKTNGSPSLVSYDMAIQQIEKETFTGPKGSQTPLP